MKITLVFKTPDVLDQIYDLSDDERNEARYLIENFVKYGEYIHVEFDTASQTAVVLPLGTDNGTIKVRGGGS